MNASTDFIDANLERGRGDHLAVIEADSGRELTYAELAHAVCRAGHALTRLGVRPEERVVILLPDSAAFAAAFFGAIRIGAVAVPVNTLLTNDDYRYLLDDSRARALIVHEQFAARIDAMRASLPRLEHILVVGDGQSTHARFADLLAREPETLAPVDMHRDDAALWLYSSGTTGAPKGVIHLQPAMRCCAEAFGVGILGLSAADRTFSAAKLAFAYGLGNALYMPLFVGASTVLLSRKPEPAVIFDVVRRYQPTVLFAVPTAYAAMLAAMDAGASHHCGSLRRCSSAGEPLAGSLYERWRAHTGTEILDGIGSTEALHTFIANRAGQVRPGSSGAVVDGYEARVVDADGRELPPGEIGDLLIKGRSLCAGYWHNQEQTGLRLNGGWLRSGDTYSRDADGFFWFQGRSDDMMKAGGYWVSPSEIEAALLTHPCVLECAVVGREDAARLVKPMAFIVLRAGHLASTELGESLKAHVKGQLAVYKYPRWIEFVTELPRSATGKVQRTKLRARLEQTAS